MAPITESLQKLFAELVAGEAMEYWSHGSEWVLEKLTIPSRAKSAPVFFLASTASVSETEACPNQKVDDLRLPFPAFWLCYRSDVANLVSNHFIYFEREAQVMKLGVYERFDTKDSWTGKVHEFNDRFKFESDLYPVERKYIQQALEVLAIISKPVEQIPCKPNFLTRRKLSKGGVPPRILNFINVLPTRTVQRAPIAGGAAKSPHNRQGHWRTYKSGQKVWIRDCAIHGGSQKARNYAVHKK